MLLKIQEKDSLCGHTNGLIKYLKQNKKKTLPQA